MGTGCRDSAPLQLRGGMASAAGALTKVLIFVAVASELVLEGEARSSSSRSSSKDKDGPTRAAIATLCFLFLLCGGGIGWCLYLESRPDMWRTRFAMYVVLALSTVFELALCARAVFVWWMWPVILVMNSWGALDAILRFPVLHGFDTMFALKQVVLLVVRVGLYIYGLSSFSDNRIVFFAALMLNILGLPLMYVLALPLDDTACEQAGAARMVVDVDIFVRIGRAVLDPKERRECMLHCSHRARQMVAGAARRSSLLSQAACRLDPQMRKVLQKSGRDV